MKKFFAVASLLLVTAFAFGQAPPPDPEQGVITGLFMSIIEALVNGVFALLPDLNIDSALNTTNTTADLDTLVGVGTNYQGNPIQIVLSYLASFNILFPIREAIQWFLFGVTGYIALWLYFYVWKAIKTVRGSG